MRPLASKVRLLLLLTGLRLHLEIGKLKVLSGPGAAGGSEEARVRASPFLISPTVVSSVCMAEQCLMYSINMHQ